MSVVGWPRWFLLMPQWGMSKWEGVVLSQTPSSNLETTSIFETDPLPPPISSPKFPPSKQPGSRLGPGPLHFEETRVAKAHRLLFVWSILEEEAAVQARCIHAKERQGRQGCQGRQGWAPVTQPAKKSRVFFFGKRSIRRCFFVFFFCGGLLMMCGWTLKWSCWKNMCFLFGKCIVILRLRHAWLMEGWDWVFFWLRTALLLGVFNKSKIANKLSTEECTGFFLVALKGSKRNKNKEPIRGHGYFQWLNPTMFMGFVLPVLKQMVCRATVRFSKPCCKVWLDFAFACFFVAGSVFVFKSGPLLFLIPLTERKFMGIIVFEWNTWKTSPPPPTRATFAQRFQKTESARSDEWTRSDERRQFAMRLGVRGGFSRKVQEPNPKALQFRSRRL